MLNPFERLVRAQPRGTIKQPSLLEKAAVSTGGNFNSKVIPLGDCLEADQVMIFLEKQRAVVGYERSILQAIPSLLPRQAGTPISFGQLVHKSSRALNKGSRQGRPQSVGSSFGPRSRKLVVEVFAISGWAEQGLTSRPGRRGWGRISAIRPNCGHGGQGLLGLSGPFVDLVDSFVAVEGPSKKVGVQPPEGERFHAGECWARCGPCKAHPTSTD